MLQFLPLLPRDAWVRWDLLSKTLGLPHIKSPFLPFTPTHTQLAAVGSFTHLCPHSPFLSFILFSLYMSVFNIYHLHSSFASCLQKSKRFCLQIWCLVIWWSYPAMGPSWHVTLYWSAAPASSMKACSQVRTKTELLRYLTTGTAKCFSCKHPFLISLYPLFRWERSCDKDQSP